MLREALNNQDLSEDAITLAKAATIISIITAPSLLDVSHQLSRGFTAFKPLVTISLIFNGPNLKYQDRHESQACGQAILYNTKKRASDFSVDVNKQDSPLVVSHPCLYIFVSIYI